MGTRTGSTWRTAAVLAMAAAASVPAPEARGEDGRKEVPFPVEHTAILKEEKVVYTVEGRVTIPKGVEVTCLRDVHVVAKGEGATIVVEGSLKIHGVGDREVIFEGVTVEPAPVFKDIRMDQTIFRKGGGIRSPPGKPVDGYMLLELIDFTAGARLALTFVGGSVELATLCSDDPVEIRAVDPDPTKPNRVRAEIRGCIENPRVKCQPHGGRVGMRGGLLVEGVDDVVVRLSRLGGALTAVRDWRKGLIFDGNKVDSKRLEFRQPKAGAFSGAQFFKCDVYAEKVVFEAPPADDPKQRDEAPLDRWWFKGITDPKEILAGVIEDGEDAPEKNGVRVRILKVNERALELAGPLIR